MMTWEQIAEDTVHKTRKRGLNFAEEAAAFERSAARMDEYEELTITAACYRLIAARLRSQATNKADL